jgi:Tfp pilus assembly protein PilX
MRVGARHALATSARRLARRLRRQDGFTMIVALGVMAVTALLSAAVFLAVNGDAYLSRADLDGKRAYAAAQAGLQAYLYQLNDNSASSSWWETCSNDALSQTTVPGSTTGASYSYKPVLANGATTCSTTNPVGSLIDTSTGTLRMKFTGYSGSATRTIVAGLRTLSPLSFLWYTKYETIDTSIGGSTCATMFYQSPGPPSSCDIYWVTGDHMNGPMYTQDQFLVSPGNAPTFGRSGSTDQIASQVPTKGTNDICASSNCQSAVVSNPAPDVTPQVPLPSDNSNLLSDATNHGIVYTGTVTLTVSINSSGATVANGFNCTSSTSCTKITNLALSTTPIIYAQNASGCNSTYSPTSITYTTITSGQYTGAYYGPCGDIYISGTYNTPLTVAAANDVVLTDNLLNSTDANPTGTASPSGSATLGLVANEYVRVMHTCSGDPNVTIDGAILTLQHSFFVDNYNCGGTQGTLTVHGAIAQYFRGIVGQVGSNGYLKNYNYDTRLALILPPYLFDLQNTEWEVFRETLCSTAVSTASSNSCGV